MTWENIRETNNENVTLKYKIEKINKEWKLIAYDLEQKIKFLISKLDNVEEEKLVIIKNSTLSERCSKCNPPNDRRIILTWQDRYCSIDTFSQEQYESMDVMMATLLDPIMASLLSNSLREVEGKE